MATTISSGRGNSPLLTANIADHGTIYGGRGLIFDGVTDYLEVNDATVGNVVSSACTISMWAKFDDVTTHLNTDVLFSAFNDGVGQPRFQLQLYTVVNGGIVNYLRVLYEKTGDSLTITYTEPMDTGWHHLVFVEESNTSRKLYKDGKLITATSTVYETGSSFTPATSYDSIAIGAYREGVSFVNNPHEGTISDVKLFSSALTEAQVQELYLKPEQSAPSAVQDNMVAWYPMCEGNPDSPQSIVYDHSEKKLGAELLATTGWGLESVWTLSGGILTFDDEGNGRAELAAADMTNGTGLATGKTYKFQFTISDLTGGVASIKVEDSGGAVELVALESYDNGTHTKYFTAPSGANGDGIEFIGYNGASTSSFNISDYSLKEVLMGNHATTVFYGAELIDETNNREFTASTGVDWALYDPSGGSAVAISVDSAVANVLQVTTTTDNAIEGAQLAIANIDNAAAEPVVAGATYRISVDLKLTTPGSGTFSMIIGLGGTLTSAFNITTSSVTYTKDIITTNNTGALLIYNTSATATVFEIDNVSVKEVGISSAGFATADSEPTIPQVPLLRYNEKMVFDGVDDKVDLTTSAPRPGTSDFSISFWLSGLVNMSDRRMFGTEAGVTTAWSLHGESSDTTLRWNGTLTAISSALPNSGTWGDGTVRHVVISADRSGNLVYYLNGAVLSSHDISSHSAVDFSYIRYIGSYNNAASGEFAQMNTFDELSQYNVALSATEAQELFNDGVALDATTHSKKDYLVGYWRNDGISSWLDRAPEKMLFDGTNDRVRYGNIIDGYTSLTMSAWFKTTYDKQNDIIGQYSGSSTIGARLQARGGTAGIWWAIGNGGAGVVADYVDSGAHRDGNWHHVVGTYDGTTMKLYYDGATTPVATASHPDQTMNDTNGLDIGGTYPEYMNGMIDECALWNTDITATEVAELYALGLNGDILTHSNQTNLVSYWKNEGITTASWEDKKGSNDPSSIAGSPVLIGGNNGTPAGTPESIIVREGLNSNKDGLGFPFKNDDRDVLRFMGNSPKEYLSIADSDSFDVQGDFTVEFWMKQPDIGISYQHIVNRDDTSNRNWTLYSNNGALTLTIYSGGTGTTSTTTATFDDDNWHHVCGIVKAGTSIQIYVDKVLEKLSSGYSASGVLAAVTEAASASSVTLTVDTVSATDALFKNKEVYKSDGTFFGICTAVNSTTEIVFAGGLSNQITNNDNLHPAAVPITIDNDPTVFNVGRRVDEAQYFKGLVDEVRFYNKALTSYKANGDAPAEGETATSGEVVKNYKHGKGKHKN